MSVIATARAAELLSSLGDPVRLAIIASLVGRQRTLAEVAAAVDVPVRRAGDGLARLVAFGVVERVEGGYTARLDVLRDAAAGLDATHPVTGLLDDFPKLRGVFSHGRLVGLPELSVHGADLARLLCRLVALDGPVDEPEINRRLAVISDDVAMLRRLMVDEGVLRRDPAGTTYAPAG